MLSLHFSQLKRITVLLKNTYLVKVLVDVLINIQHAQSKMLEHLGPARSIEMECTHCAVKLEAKQS